MSITHLLERNLIATDDTRAGDYLAGKTILITGAAGSVGSELARRMQAFCPKQVILLDCAESALYELEWEIRHFFPQLNFEAVLCNIIDFEQVTKVFAEFQPDVVFHTAAYKQVPLLEKYPEQAVLTNILGTKNVADLTQAFHSEKFIFISTDKAVNPVSVMGMSKKVAENYLRGLGIRCDEQETISNKQLAINNQQFNNATIKQLSSLITDHSPFTQFIITRFGNVFGSNGSVVPLFEKQIQAGGPITLTHTEMTRYFMAISEAAQLVLEAGNLGNNGEIFWFNVAKPVSILNLAKQMMKMLGKNVEIRLTGIRAGEKIHEEWINAENCRILQKSPYLIAIEEAEEIDFEYYKEKVEELVKIAQKGDRTSIINLLKVVSGLHSQVLLKS